MPATAHAPGLDGTRWRTDLDIYMPDTFDFDSVLFLGFRPTGGDAGAVIRRDIDVPPGTSLALRDVVANLFQTTGTGSISIEVAQLGGSSPPTISTRTYNQTPEGTYGRYLAGVSFDDSLQHGEAALLVGLERSVELRNNIGALNLTAAPIAVAAVFLDAAGAELGRLDIALEPFGFQPVNGAVPGWREVDGGVALVSSPTPDAVFLAYASVVDNRTGDPTFIPAGRVAMAAGT